MRVVIEDDEERLVRRIEQLDQEAAQGRLRVRHPLAVHALADVEHHTEADRDAAAVEVRDLLPGSVLEELEVGAGEVADQPSAGIAHGDRDRYDVDPGPEAPHAVARRLLRKGGDARRQQQRGQGDGGPCEPAGVAHRPAIIIADA